MKVKRKVLPILNEKFITGYTIRVGALVCYIHASLLTEEVNETVIKRYYYGLPVTPAKGATPTTNYI